MSEFNVIDTPLPGLRMIERHRLVDARGFFSRFFCAEALAAAGFDRSIAQINHTRTHRRGSVRGLHFQYPPHAETKLVSCLSGEIFDVVVDLRRDSSTFLQWHAEVLSDYNGRSLLIPQGFAHGFQTLSDEAVLIYLHSAPFEATAQGALNVRDPALAIDWPLPFADISERDANHPLIGVDFTGLDP
ncbi:dTDP-4-dehydrorhamnose 3,5-epimerase [soil metagenome]